MQGLSFSQIRRVRCLAGAGQIPGARYRVRNRYGTPSHLVNDVLGSGRDVLFDIDWQGTQQLKERSATTDQIFILPPVMTSWSGRPAQSRQDSDEIVAGRMGQGGGRDQVVRASFPSVAGCPASRYRQHVAPLPSTSLTRLRGRAIAVAEHGSVLQEFALLPPGIELFGFEKMIVLANAPRPGAWARGGGHRSWMLPSLSRRRRDRVACPPRGGTEPASGPAA